MEIKELNRIRKMMGYTAEGIAEASGLPAEKIGRVLEGEETCEQEELKKIQNAVLELIRRDAASGNIVHEEVMPYLTGR